MQYLLYIKYIYIKTVKLIYPFNYFSNILFHFFIYFFKEETDEEIDEEMEKNIAKVVKRIDKFNCFDVDIFDI